MNQRTASIVGGIGRTLIALGLLVLSFAAFQLWGTNLQEARNQSELENEFAERRAAVAALAPEMNQTTTTQPEIDGETTTTAPPSTLSPELIEELADEIIPEIGESMGNIQIPSIGVDKGFVFGTRRGDLRKGPGLYPSTPFPGQAGNTAIAGHRTTYGAPFGDLDLVQPGDEIVVETVYGTYYYEVLPQIDAEGNEVGYFIVDDSAVEVVDDQGDNRLTLTACHPKFSAAQRIIVSAKLVSAPAPELPAITAPALDELADEEFDEPQSAQEAIDLAAEENVLTESLGWNTEETWPTVLWGVAAALVVVAGFLFGKAWKRLPAYAAISPVFLYVLWGCFTHLDKLLPAL